MGDRSKISFWHDLCCMDSLLNISYPDLFSVSRSKDVWVADNLQFRDENIHWNVIVIRPVQDWEVDVVFLFFEMYYFRVKQGDVDRISWSPSKRSKLK